MATPPTMAMRKAFFTTLVLEIWPLIAPRTRSATTEKSMESVKAAFTGQNTYGERGMNPETKYEQNITAPEMRLLLFGLLVPLAYSSADDSDKKLPAAIENASTKMSTAPVRKMVSRGTSAIAMPERRPTVETKLSSTPKMKFLK